MRLKKIKKYFLERKYTALLKSPVSGKAPIHKKVTTVGILTIESISKRYDLQSLISKNFDVRNTKIYSYRPYHKENEPSYKHFSENDFDVRGKIKDAGFRDFLDTEFDLLITLFDKKHLYVEYATLVSKAAFKIGFARINQSLFDLEIRSRISDLETYLNEARKYLQILNKIDAEL